MKECMETSTIFILVNGSLMERFKQEKDFDRGSLAPFLYLITRTEFNRSCMTKQRNTHSRYCLGG